MTNDVKKVPELRFPEFNEDWNERTLSDSIKILKSGLSRELSTTDIGLPVIRANNLQNYNLVLDDIKYWFKEDPKGAKTENYYLEKNDILVNFINSEAKMGTSCIIKSDFKRDTIYTTNILRYVTKEAYDSYFHYIYTQTYNYKKWIKIITKPAVNQASFTTVDFKKIPYYIPEFKEQQKIGEFFSKLDRQIELEEQKLAKLEEQKKVYMQKIFSQELRFKDENGNEYPEWEEKKLKDVLEFSNKRTINHNEYPVLTSSRQGLLLQSDYYKEGKTFGENNIGYFIIPKNYITYRSRSDDGIFKFNLNEVIDVGIISKYYPVFKGKSSNQYYLTMHLNYQLKKEYIKYATGTSQLVLSQNNLQDIKTKLPTYEEQNEIAEFFRKLDNLMKKQSNKVNFLKERKQGLLQKMFI
ncbi:restriction endonuclease subunit S [Mammaliicoccus sciuri]|uniref:restriction endonuclease subunit S n=1 Tax=Mammaliicoccus sciuri TaxID=1296 RepID=UPI0021CF9927|nr:restriction endonuclease subunit S [Mammaliicoccus sciuri]UXU83927.1 restriction endonuclease subunit S [Mammaliicoccus sciuri]UXU93774.1 restriction endonuclease subunit S [Mammaliicoccus sciuri]UXV15722.1 restriction endonuclease subunit S [Mammaliicoccus sciuri]UXV23984.1 restriction endonuclease subunit S [Mammaliicoccus sciuri]UXV26765.1 restriction endonuclease subunit S [Mammaliicoccus sciuri]